MKFDSNYINQNRDTLIQACYQNARRLKKAAKLLIDHKDYATAIGRVIEALEEIAKAKKLEKKLNTNFSELVNHSQKGIEIMQISAQQYGLGNVSQENLEWAEKRIPQMREDSTYVRLKPTKNNQVMPDNNYWRKRAKGLYRFLNDI